MTQFLVSAIALIGIHAVHAYADDTPASAQAAREVQSDDSTAEEASAEKSIFEPRTFDEEVRMLQALGADDFSTTGG